MDNEEISKQILKRRKQLMINRVCYYVYSKPLIEDHVYDKWNRELIELNEGYPEIASKVQYHDIDPAFTVGSENIQDYPMEIARLAQGLLNFKGRI